MSMINHFYIGYKLFKITCLLAFSYWSSIEVIFVLTVYEGGETIHSHLSAELVTIWIIRKPKELLLITDGSSRISMNP